MKMTLIIFTITFLASCSALIYKIRGPKYEGKFVVQSYPKDLDSTTYYWSVSEYGQKHYNYIKYKNNGIYYSYTSQKFISSVDELDTLISFKNHYLFKNGFLKWEIYHNSYDGYNLFKAKVYDDSIVCWQVPYKRMKKVYVKLK